MIGCGSNIVSAFPEDVSVMPPIENEEMDNETGERRLVGSAKFLSDGAEVVWEPIDTDSWFLAYCNGAAIIPE